MCSYLLEHPVVEVDELKLFYIIHYARKKDINCSKLGSNCQLLINTAKEMFVYEIRIYFFQCKFLFNISHQYANMILLVTFSMPLDEY